MCTQLFTNLVSIQFFENEWKKKDNNTNFASILYYNLNVTFK